MTREEAKAEIRKVFEPAFANYIITALTDGATPSERKEKWIPVAERLPEEKKAVLVWCPQYKNLYCAYRENEQWWIFGSYSHRIVDDVVAWMPYEVLLTEPYGYGTEMEQ